MWPPQHEPPVSRALRKLDQGRSGARGRRRCGIDL